MINVFPRFFSRTTALLIGISCFFFLTGPDNLRAETPTTEREAFGAEKTTADTPFADAHFADTPFADTPFSESAELVSRVNEKWASLDDFEAAIEIHLASPGVTFPGTLRQKGNFVRLDLEAPARLLHGHARAGDERETVILSFDGAVFWQLIPLAGHLYVRKTDYRAREEETGQPAPALSFEIPSLDYRLETGETENGKFFRLETDDAESLIGAMLFPATSLALNMQPLARAVITVEAETLLPRRIEGLDRGGKTINRVEFHELVVNQGLEDEIFTPEFPEDAFVIPITP